MIYPRAYPPPPALAYPRQFGVPEGVAVPVDGPSSWRVPSTAAQFAAIGIIAPDALWPCQEASGNLTDVIGGLTLTAAGAVTYQNTIAGWSRKAVGIPDAAATGFRRAAGLSPNPATTDQLWLAYIVFGATPAATRNVITGSDSAAGTELQQGHGAGRVHRNKVLGVATGGAATMNANTHACALLYDRTNARVASYVNSEKVNGTYGAGVVDGNKGLGAGVLASAPMSVLWAAMWMGAGARLSDAQVAALYTALNLAPAFS